MSVRSSYVALCAALLVAACGSDDPTGSVCSPGQQRCSANAYEVCAGDGERWAVAEDCALSGELCVLNLGCKACVPNNLSCGADGFDIVRCNGDGTQNDLIGRCDPEIGEQCIGGACENACDHAAASRSYEGCEYWATDLDNAVVSNLGTAAAQQFSLVVSNPLELPATVRVSVNDAPPGMPPVERIVAETYLSRVVGGGDLAVIDLDPRELDCASDPRLNDGDHSCVSSNAYHITSTAPIVAYQFNPLENVDVFSNDASLLLPVSALDTQYLVLSWPQTLATTNVQETNANIDLRAFLTIVGTAAQTHVQVLLSTGTIGSPTIPTGNAGDTLEFDIGPYDVINLETDDFNADFTGTSITADRPIAVFTGSEASDVPFFDTFAERQCCADHLEEQLFPESAFGTQFIAVKTPLRTRYVDEAGWDVAVVPDESEWWRILGSAEDTSITTDLPPPNDQFLITRGQVVTFSSERDFTVQASKPVSFAQFPGSQFTTGIPSVLGGGVRPPGGDPSMILVPPVQQWKDKYVFLVPNKYAFDFLLLAAPADANILFDDEDLAFALPRCEYEPIGTLWNGMNEVEYQAIRCPLSNPIPENPQSPLYQNDGRHVLESAGGEPFGLIVWGWDSFVSYGYPGGTNIEQINPL